MYSDAVVSFVVRIFTVGLLLCLPVVAQGPSNIPVETPPAAAASGQPGSPPPPQKGSASDDDVWHFDLAPYVFIPGMHGTVGILGHEASVHVSGASLFSNFNGGFATYFQARKGRLVIPIDFTWARIGTTQGIPLNDLGQTSVRFLTSQVILTPKIGYRILDGEHFKVDATVGARYWHEGINITPRPANVTFSRGANWVDALGGLDFVVPLNDKLFLTAITDVGAGAADLDYQGMGFLVYQPKPLLGLFLGYRYLYVDYSQPLNDSIFNIVQAGPMFGLNLEFGGKPPVPPSASCSVSPTEVWAGEPVTATLNTANFNPKHTLTYAWTSTGAKVSGTTTTGNVDTAGLAPGNYGITGTATDPKEKKNNVASCNASFTVKTPHPPTATCSASPDTVKAGDGSTVTVNATSPDNFPLTYAWSSNAGRISGTGTSASLDTTGAPQGSAIVATATVTDSRGLSTSCTANVNVLSPPVVVNEVTEVGECKFMDEKRPARVDNACKAVLDDVALKIQHEPNGKFVIVGYAEDEESVKMTQVGAQRAVNVKYYLVNGEGGSQIDATRLDVRTTGTVKEKGTKIYFVPTGASFSQESVAVDETQVKGQSRNAPAPHKKARKKAPATPPPSQ